MALTKIDYAALPELELAGLLARRDPEAVRVITRRSNQRLFRAAWAILKNRAEAEDAVQSAYLNAFAAIGEFEGRSSLSTWLTRIVVNEALGRARAARRRAAHLDAGSVADIDHYREKLMQGSATHDRPDGEFARAQVRRLLEAAVARLPTEFRTVSVLREIEEMSVEDTAQVLDILPATVKTRLLRARLRLREDLAPEVRATLDGAFPFAGADCAAMTGRVLEELLDRAAR